MSIHPFRVGRVGQSLSARQEDSKLGLGRTCISITMKFINEVVTGGVTIILFVVCSDESCMCS